MDGCRVAGQQAPPHQALINTCAWRARREVVGGFQDKESTSGLAGVTGWQCRSVCLNQPRHCNRDAGAARAPRNPKAAGRGFQSQTEKVFIFPVGNALAAAARALFLNF